MAAQGILLGIFPLLVHKHLTLPVTLIVIVAVVVKVVVIPSIMMRALRDAQIRREVEP